MNILTAAEQQYMPQQAYDKIGSKLGLKKT